MERNLKPLAAGQDSGSSGALRPDNRPPALPGHDGASPSALNVDGTQISVIGSQYSTQLLRRVSASAIVRATRTGTPGSGLMRWAGRW